MIIKQAELERLSAPQEAALIYSQSKSALTDRLWRAALGDVDRETTGPGAQPGLTGQSFSLEGLMALLPQPGTAPVSIAPTYTPVADQAATGMRSPLPPEIAEPAPDSAVTHVVGLGANARYGPELTDAALRTGIPAPALAAIVNAEAAKTADGSWQPFSRNTRSSAAGLGQFLSGTWQGMAEMKGTWLNGVARSKGWLDSSGKILAGARSAVLAMRYEASASINTIADYASHNINGLRRRGVQVGADLEGIARTAYVGHHLGLADAARFLTGGLDPAHAQMLLGAQIGIAKANQQIAQVGNAAMAHRQWFMNYVTQHLQPNHFAA